MAKQTKADDPIGYPEIEASRAVELIDAQIESAKNIIAKRPISSDTLSSWELVTKNILEKAFGKNSDNVKSVTNVGKYGAFKLDAGEEYWENRRFESITTQISKMESLIKVLQLELPVIIESETERVIDKNKIFIVHGHNNALLNDLARFIEKLGLIPIILRELPNIGKTIIEKFENYSDVGFAVVLLTADDEGYSKADNIKHDRARQNVIFELGYFIGKLERSNVCALYETGVELPSDFSGIVYTEIDASGYWKINLAREIKASGYYVDMNKVI